MTLQFINRDPDSSVYSSVTNELRLQSDIWVEVHRDEKTEATFSFDLMFGEKNLLPYHKLGQNPGLLQLVNYYRGAGNICRKCSMVRTLKRCFQPEELSKWLPESYIIFPKHLMDAGSGDYEELSQKDMVVRNRRRACDEREECLVYNDHMKETEGKAVWIAKSSAGCKGEGIRISENIHDLLTYIDRHKQGFILQRYIIHPMLLPGDRKFDVRIWVVLDPHLRILAFKEGVLRTASERYNPDDWSDIPSHLTNHSIQETKSKNYGKYEKDNEIFFTEFSKILEEKYAISFDEKIKPQAYSIIKTCVDAIKEDIRTDSLGYRSFQLLGFDFLIDQDGIVWLLEVNGAPASAQRLLVSLTEAIVTSVINPFFMDETDDMAHKKYFDDITDFKS